MTSKLQQILAESKKTYPFKIGIVGEPKDIDIGALETTLQKFVVEKMSSGKKTPITKRPLDFPHIENQSVTYFDVELTYPTTSSVLHNYLTKSLGIAEAHMVVRNPNEPTEQYQAEKDDAPYEAKLNSPYEDSKDEQKSAGQSRVIDLLKELEKERKERSAPDAAGDITPGGNVLPNEGDSKNKMSPISGKSKGK